MNPKEWHLLDWIKLRAGITNIKLVKVFVTQKCNAKCVTCEVWKRKPISLNLNQAYAIADYFKTDKMVVSGGEALTWEYLEQFINRIQCKSIALNTNGTLPDKLNELLPKIQKIDIAISLNGIGEIHDKSRGIKAYNKILKSIDIVKKYGFNCVIAFALFQENIREYEKVKKFVEDNNLTMTLCFPVNAGRLINQWHSANDEDLKRIYTERMKKDSYFGQWIWQYWMDRVFNNKPMRCLAGFQKIVIQPNGNIEACPEWEGSVIGTVTNKIIWDNKKYNNIKKMLKNFQCPLYSGKEFCGSAYLERSPWSCIPEVIEWKIKQSL